LRRIAIGIALGLAAGLVSCLAAIAPIARDFEARTYDWRLRSVARPVNARADIALVLINESSLRALEPQFGGWPWPRFLHAGVVDFLARSHARLIAYDVLFTDRDRRSAFTVGGRTMTGDESDAELVASVKRAGNVVLLGDAVFEGLENPSASLATEGPPAHRSLIYRPGPGFEDRPPLRLPFAELADAALAVGHNFQVKDPGGTDRRIRPFVLSGGVAVPSLGLAAALAVDRPAPETVRLEGPDGLRIGSHVMPVLSESVPPRAGEAPKPSRQALVNFHGPFETPQGRQTYAAYSFFDVLLSENSASNGEKPAIDPSVFRDKIVFVGTSGSGMSDILSTPFEGGGMPGAQLHAAVADDVVSGRYMTRASLRTDAILTIVVGVLAGVIATCVPVVWAVPAVLVIAAGLVAWLKREVGFGLWIGAVAPIAALSLATFEGVAWQYFVEGREKREVKRLFGRYVSRDVFDHLIADPSLARLGGQRREMTVLFSDIRGFTSASEQGTPEDVVAQLNEYFSAMVDVLFRHQGTLDKFVGDMVMGLFGAPLPDARHADHAVAAALEMTDVLDDLNGKWKTAGKPPLDIGIGINSGEMIAGNIGSETIMSYTVIGDAVNLGARLESLNKDYGTRILISGETRSRLTSAVATRRIGDVTVKGRTKPVEVFEVLRRAPQERSIGGLTL
jgi:adenylate cyclase